MIDIRRLSIAAGIMIFLALNSHSAGTPTRAAVTGSLAGAKGTVQVNQNTAQPQEVVFAGDVVSTGGSSAAIMNLRNGNIVALVENSEISFLGSSDVGALTLVKGALVISSRNSQSTRVDVPGASVIVGGGGTFPSICTIASIAKSAVVIADKGHVEIRGVGVPTIVLPGRTVHLEAGMPQGGGQVAGAVTAAIPQETVQRGGHGAGLPLSLKDTVYWQDIVNTLRNGRVRISLTDGSVLNVGAGSTMHIIQHDAQTQQTEIELTAGRLRSVVAKITKPGGKFETRTPTAVIGVVGTTPIVHVVNPNATDVFSEEGDVSVANIDPNVPGTVILHTGQFTTVLRGLAPAAASTASAGQIASQMNQTNISQGGQTGAGAGQTTTQATTSTATNASSNAGRVIAAASNVSGATTVAAVGTTVGIGSAAAIRLATARTAEQAANTALSHAATAISQAASSDASAAAAATQASTAAAQAQNAATVTAIQAQIIIAQGCGCVSPSVP